jgi:hypothetical protein
MKKRLYGRFFYELRFVVISLLCAKFYLEEFLHYRAVGSGEA